MSNRMSGRADASAAVQSVDRALSALEVIARYGEAGITDIAREIGVHKSTAFRLISTLEGRDLVEQNDERGKYRLGVGILRLAGATTMRLDLVQEGRPVCRRLAAEVGETVNIVVLSDREALYLDQVSGPSALGLHNWVGQRIPLHATSNGKVLLAHLPDHRLEDTLVLPMRRYTDATIVDLTRLRAELRLVRERGYATAVDEFETGLTAVAAPIIGMGGEVVASVSASGPSFRLPLVRLPEIASAVMRAAAEVSSRLGWSGRAKEF